MQIEDLAPFTTKKERTNVKSIPKMFILWFETTERWYRISQVWSKNHYFFSELFQNILLSRTLLFLSKQLISTPVVCHFYLLWVVRSIDGMSIN